MTDHDVVVTPDGVFIDGKPCPYAIAPDGVSVECQSGATVVTLRIFANTVTVLNENPQPQMTQADARAIFAKRNPSAFKETSA